MAGAIHKMAVYLGLVEDEVAYEDGYDSAEEDYAAYEGEDGAGPQAARSPASIEVTAEDKARIAERGVFNQS